MDRGNVAVGVGQVLLAIAIVTIFGSIGYTIAHLFHWIG